MEAKRLAPLDGYTNGSGSVRVESSFVPGHSKQRISRDDITRQLRRFLKQVVPGLPEIQDTTKLDGMLDSLEFAELAAEVETLMPFRNVHLEPKDFVSLSAIWRAVDEQTQERCSASRPKRDTRFEPAGLSALERRS